MAKIPPADTPIIDRQSGRISLEWYTALQRLVSEIVALGGGGVVTFEGRSGAVTSQSGDYTASEVTNSAAGNIAATDVQSALNELDTEKTAVTRQIISGAGLTGGGDLSADRTLAVGAGTGITVNANDVQTNDAQIVHSALSGYVADEHIAHSGVTLTAGAGLTGGGTIAASRTFDVGAGTGITVNANDVAITAGGVGTTQLADEGVTLAKLEHALAYTILLRNAGTTGDPAYTKISALTDAGAFGSGDKLMIEESSGEIRKIDYDNLPGAAGSGLSTVALQAFTASGTYTPTAGMEFCIVISTGGGGGGGGADGGDVGMNAAAGGGGAGGTCIELFNAATIGASQTVTIGAAGTAGADTGGNGGLGGNTTFGALHTATGGGVGVGATTTGILIGGRAAGGVPVNGLVNITGGDGMPGYVEGTSDFQVGGQGGGSFWGGGPAGAVRLNSAGATAGNNGAAYGSGGGGAVCQDSTTGAAGGTGAAGVVMVIEFI
jgi:hypothetical protein